MPDYDALTIPDDYLEMSSGRKFWLRNPIYDAREIAHSLSLLCRYAGHCKRFYSVGEHSVLVADIMRHFDLGDPFEGLMHDATECVLSDICSPIKHGMLPDYKNVENHFDRALRAQFGLPETMTAECKRADWVALALEAKILLSTGGASWSMPEYARAKADEYLSAFPAAMQLGFEPFDRVRSTWLSLYNMIGPQK